MGKGLELGGRDKELGSLQAQEEPATGGQGKTLEQELCPGLHQPGFPPARLTLERTRSSGCVLGKLLGEASGDPELSTHLAPLWPEWP